MVPKAYRGPDHLLNVRPRRVKKAGVAQRRYPVEIPHEHNDGERADPERWRGESDNGDDAQNVVQPAILSHGGDRANGDGDHRGDQCGEQGKLKGHREALPDLVPDRRPRLQRDAEIQTQHPNYPLRVLLVVRFVQAELLTHGGERFLGDETLIARTGQYGESHVAGEDAHDNEDNERHAQHHRAEEQQPAGDVGAHGYNPAAYMSARGWLVSPESLLI